MKYQHRVLGMLSLLSIITYVDRVCIAVAGPRMQDDLHISPQAWGWVTSVFFLSYSAFEIPSGVLGDRIGPRRVLTRIVLWWSAFTSLTGTVSSYSLLLLVRFCFGMGEAGAYPNASTVIARWIPPPHRARAWGIVWMTSQIGAAISPLLVVPIQVRYGWRASFYVFGFLGVIWAAAWYAWFRDSPGREDRRHCSRAAGDRRRSRRSAMADALGTRRCATGTLWRIAAIGACYVYALAFFQVVAADLSGQGTRLHGSGAGAVVAAVRRRCLRERHRRTRQRLAGSPIGPEDGTPRPWGVRARLRRHLHGGDDRDDQRRWALVFLSLAYAGILVQQPNLCAVCLDTGRKHAGAVFGFMNTAANAASAVSSIAFGYLVAYFGNYNAPFVPDGGDALRGRVAVAEDRSDARAVRRGAGPSERRGHTRGVT